MRNFSGLSRCFHIYFYVDIYTVHFYYPCHISVVEHKKYINELVVMVGLQQIVIFHSFDGITFDNIAGKEFLVQC